MICTMASAKGKRRIDTDKVAGRYLEGRPLYVQPVDEEERAVLVSFLRQNGFVLTGNASDGGDNIRKPYFPLIISLKDKTVSVMGNVTCSAAAAGSGIVIGVREFCLLFSLDPAGRNRSSAARTGNSGGEQK